MSKIRYVVRVFDHDIYIYSVHVDSDILQEVLEQEKINDHTVKVLAYKTEYVEVEG